MVHLLDRTHHVGAFNPVLWVIGVLLLLVLTLMFAVVWESTPPATVTPMTDITPPADENESEDQESEEKNTEDNTEEESNSEEV